MSAAELRRSLPADHVATMYTSWAALRAYAVSQDLGCLTVVRLDAESMHDVVALEPSSAQFETLLRALDEPALRMLAIITAVDGETDYRAQAKAQGAKFVGDGGKVMTATLTSADTTPEQQLSAIGEKFTARVEEKDGCCTVEIMVGETLASTGKTTVKDGIATFDGIYTDMGFQRRGLATCVMAFLTRWAMEHGGNVGMLCASPFGQLLYEGLGWTSIYNVVSIGGEPALGFLERMRLKYAPKSD